MKYSIVTFGCRVNQADSLGFEEALLAGGGQAVSPIDADLVVVNTCSVTAAADQGARQAVRRIARTNPDVRIVMTGCYATRCGAEVAALPNVVQIIRNPDKEQFAAIVGDLGVSTAARFGDGQGSCGALLEPGVAGRTAFTLRVQTGCAQPCAYCIIPVTRGAPRSVPVETVRQELARAVAAGFREVALTGVHLGSYGRDLPRPSSLAELLDELSASGRGAVRLRISSLEPMDCVPAIVDLVERQPMLARHFHLPLQHASDRMLRCMRRPYTLAQYAALVDDIRTRMPEASIGSDVIVGFPGETDDDFAQLAAYLERSPLSHVHVFPYSDRPGTAATAMPDKVSGLVIRERAQQVRAVSARLAERFRSSQVGTVHRGLALEDGSLVVTGNYLKVRIPPGRQRNDWLEVRIASADGDRLVGEVL